MALANFFLLAKSPSIKLTYKKANKEIKIITKNYKNFTSLQYLLKTSFNFSLSS